MKPTREGGQRGPDPRPAPAPRSADRLLADATRWRLVGLLLERPRADWHDEVHALARELDDAPLRRAASLARRATESGYLGILGPGGPVSPREVAYRVHGDPGRILADLRAFYEAFAFRPRAEDPLDHVCVEAGFAGYLQLKQAFALETGLAEAAERTALALREFLDAHLGGLAAELRRRLADATAQDAAGAQYLARAAERLCELIETAGVKPTLPIVDLAPGSMAKLYGDDESIGCGSCGADSEEDTPPGSWPRVV